jgi:hypothetical protein
MVASFVSIKLRVQTFFHRTTPMGVGVIRSIISTREIATFVLSARDNVGPPESLLTKARISISSSYRWLAGEGVRP